VEERKRHNGGNEDGSMDCMPACGRKEWASWSVCFGGHMILSGLIGNQRMHERDGGKTKTERSHLMMWHG
jgi:hypothetical protein